MNENYSKTLKEIERPKQVIKNEFINYSEYDFTIPWSVFKTEPLKQDFSVKTENAYFVDGYAKDYGTGTIDNPYNDVQKAISSLKSGDTLYIRGGLYKIEKPIHIFGLHGGDKKITISSYADELAIFDGHEFDSDHPLYNPNLGVWVVEDSSEILIKNVKWQNSHCKGLDIFASNNIEVYHCESYNTFACGMSVWDKTMPISAKKNAFKGFKIMGNYIRKSNTFDMIPKGRKKEGEPPHESISIAGATDFEVAFNNLFECEKEGIDVKENSINGYVHHNYVHHCARQALYADAWFGTLKNVIFEYNIAYKNEGCGLAISVEGADSYLCDVEFKNNIVYENFGTGMMISRWNKDLLRENVVITNNTFVKNGHGGNYPANEMYWVTGGVNFLSASVKNLTMERNIFSDNYNFEIGFSDMYGDLEKDIKDKNIVISDNIVDDRNNTNFPVELPWPETYNKITQYLGEKVICKKPEFKDIDNLNFNLIGEFEGENYGAKIG